MSWLGNVSFQAQSKVRSLCFFAEMLLVCMAFTFLCLLSFVVVVFLYFCVFTFLGVCSYINLNVMFSILYLIN